MLKNDCPKIKTKGANTKSAIQNIEDGQNHKWKLDVACDKDKGEIRKEQLLRTDSYEFQELVNRAILTKNSDKGISLKEKIDPGW